MNNIDEQYIKQIQLALEKAMSDPQKQEREQGEQYLKFQISQNLLTFFRALFSIIQFQQNQTISLFASIYVTKYLKTEYLKSEENFKENIQEALLQTYLQTPYPKVRTQIMLSISRVITTDFPNSKLFELLMKTFDQNTVFNTRDQLITVLYLYYSVFKALYNDQNDNKKHQEQVNSYFIQKKSLFEGIIKQQFEQIGNNIELKSLKYAIKFLSVGAHAFPHQDFTENINHLKILQNCVFSLCSQVDMGKSVENQEELFEKIDEFRKIIYTYNKYILNIVKGKQTTQYIQLINYLCQSYYQNANHLCLNNDALIQVQQLADLKILHTLCTQPKLVQFFEREAFIIMQILDLTSEIITTNSHQYNVLSQENNENHNVIQYIQQNNVVELIVSFLIQKVFILTWTHLATIHEEPEKAFLEDKGENLHLRGSGINLLSVLYMYVEEEKIINLLDQLLRKYTTTITSKNDQFGEILQREAFYYTMNGMYKYIKNSIEFEDWYNSVLSSEINLEGNQYTPLKVQILNLINTFLQNSYQVSQDIVVQVFHTLSSILCSNNNNISLYIRLLCIKCFIPLMDSEVELIYNLESLMNGTYQLFEKCQEAECKTLLLEFIENIIDFIKESNISNQVTKPIYNIISKEYTEYVHDEQNSNTLALKAQITDILSSLICKQGLEDLSYMNFISEVLNNGLVIDELSEIYLIESSLKLLYYTIKWVNENYQRFQGNEIQALQKMYLELTQKCTLIFTNKVNFFNTCILIFIEISNAPFFSPEYVCEALRQGIEMNYDEVKDEIFYNIFDVIEYIQLKHQKCEKIGDLLFILVQKCFSNGLIDEKIKLYLLRISSRLFFHNCPLGILTFQKIQNINPLLQNFLHNLVQECNFLLQQNKPDLYYYKAFVCFLLNVLYILVQESNTQNQIVFQQYVNDLKQALFVIKEYYDKSLVQDRHLILTNILSLLQEENLFQNEKEALENISITKNSLLNDPFIKLDYFEQTKTFFVQNKVQEIYENIEIDFNNLKIN